MCCSSPLTEGIRPTSRASLLHTRSAVALLVKRGSSWTRAQTPVPSDSFPEMLAQIAGGDPRTTGLCCDAS